MEIKIEKGIEFPIRMQKKQIRVQKPSKYYLLDQMEIGDSFIVEDDKQKIRLYAVMRSQKRLSSGKRYSFRNISGVKRFWRIK